MIVKAVETNNQTVFTKIVAKNMVDIEIVMNGNVSEKINMASHMILAISQSSGIPIDVIVNTVHQTAKLAKTLEEGIKNVKKNQKEHGTSTV